MKMQQFEDAEKTKWEYAVTNRTINLIKEITGINLGDINRFHHSLAQCADLNFVIQAIYICCSKAVEKRGTSLDKFWDLLEVEHLPEIRKGFTDSLRDFFRRTGFPSLAESTEEQNEKLDLYKLQPDEMKIATEKLKEDNLVKQQEFQKKLEAARSGKTSSIGKQESHTASE